MYFSCRPSFGRHVCAPRVIATASLPGRPGRVLAAPAVVSSQAWVHVTNFDYNHYPLNTMPDTRLTSHARTAAAGQVSGPIDAPMYPLTYGRCVPASAART